MFIGRITALVVMGAGMLTLYAGSILGTPAIPGAPGCKQCFAESINDQEKKNANFCV